MSVRVSSMELYEDRAELSGCILFIVVVDGY